MSSISFELSLNVTVVGALQCGKSRLIEQLLESSAMTQCLDPAQAAIDDDEPSNKKNQQEEAASTTLPSLNSVGVFFNSESLSVENSSMVNSDGVRTPVSALLRFDILEVGGATCAGAFADPEQIAKATVSRADVVLALYDMCDAASLHKLRDEILPVVFKALAAKKSPAAVLVAGTKICKRKGLSAEEKKNAVSGADQKHLERIVAESRRGALVDSVSANAGTGLRRLRRQLLFVALRSRRAQLQATPVFDARQSLWMVLASEHLALERSIGPLARALPAVAELNKENLAAAASDNNGKNNDEDPEASPPVMDVSSNRGDKKKKKGDGGEQDEGDKGVSCKLCGCTLQ